MTTQPETPRHASTWRRTALAAVLLAGTTLGGFAAGHVSFAATTQDNTTQQGNNGQQNHVTPVNPSGQNLARQQELPSFVGLVEQVTPAGVSITTRLTQSVRDNANATRHTANATWKSSESFPFRSEYPAPATKSAPATEPTP